LEPHAEWHRGWPKGDFALWNGHNARGHYVMPHGYRHANKAELPLAEAKRLIGLLGDLVARDVRVLPITAALDLAVA
jgi:hypothetical protein